MRGWILPALFVCFAVSAEDAKPLTPAEARKQLGRSIMVRMEVKTTKDRLEKRGEIYLDATEDFKDPNNFAVVISKKGTASLKAVGITDPAAHYKDKAITAKGTVREVDDVPRIDIDDARQIAVVKK